MFLLIGDLSWQTVDAPEPLDLFAELTGTTDLTALPLTPRARLWSPDSPNRAPYTLPTALARLFGHAAQPVHGPACLTAAGPRAELDTNQTAAFSHILTRLGDPTVLARHSAANRTIHRWFHQEMHHDLH